MRKTVARLRTSQLARNSTWMIAGQGLRMAVQAIYFVLIARALGVANYGTFISVAAFVAVIAPFATWGAGNIVIRNVARDPRSFRHSWGAALHTLLISSIVLGALAFLAAYVTLPKPISLWLLLEIIGADLLFARCVEMGGQAFQAFQRLSGTAMIQFLISICRMAGAAALVIITGGHANAEQWGLVYLLASFVSAAITLWAVHRELGNADWKGRLNKAEWLDGFNFSVTSAAATINNDIDKVMLARLATLDAAGAYAAGYRILDVSFVPIRSLLFAAYSRFFSAGMAGVSGTISLSRKLLPIALIYGGIISACLFMVAPEIPRILGAEYRAAVLVVRFLCVLPLLRAAQYFAAEALTGADRQTARTVVQAVIAGANVLLNLWLIPRYSWRGAIASTLATDAALAVTLWAVILVMTRRPSVEETVDLPTPPPTPLGAAAQ